MAGPPPPSVTTSISWPAIEDALQAWVKLATGYDNTHVYWADPNTARPPEDGNPFCVLEILDHMALGARPDVVQVDHSGNPAGYEIELASTEILDCGFRVQVFAPPLRGTRPGTPRGAGNAAAIAERIRMFAASASVIALLDPVNLSVYDTGKVSYVPVIVGTDFEGRGVLDIRFYVGNSVSDFTGYIQTIQVTDDIPTETGIETIITLPTEA